MNKRAIAVAFLVAGFIGLSPMVANAVSPGQAVLVCHVIPGVSGYSPVWVVLTDAYVASTVGGYKDGGADIIAPFTFSTQYDELNVPGQNWLMQKTVRYWLTVGGRYGRWVTSVIWVANPVTQGIYNAGCVVA
jgi:hypothetical protein